MTMKTYLRLAVLLLSTACSFSTIFGASLRTQSIVLKEGWNSVWLEVEPTVAKPGEAFALLPIDTVACYIPGRMQQKFLRDPGDAPWREEGWSVWYASSKPEGFLSQLQELPAQRPLLVHAKANCIWNVRGQALATVLTWYPDTCTFTGLPVSDDNPPTFDAFFSGSAAHKRLRIFRLIGNAWKVVSAPKIDRPRSGEAYWIQTDGGSSYQGPLRVRLPAAGGLHFQPGTPAYALQFANDSKNTSAQITVEAFADPTDLPLQIISQDIQAKANRTEGLARTTTLAPLRPQSKFTLHIEPARNSMTVETASSLLRITDGRGTQVWVPVTARREPFASVANQ